MSDDREASIPLAGGRSEKINDAPYSPRRDDMERDNSAATFEESSQQVRRQTTWEQFEQKSLQAEAKEKRIKRHWYPLLLLSIALNFFLLISVFYMIYDAGYYGERRQGYIVRAAVIIFPPLFPVAVLLLWPWDSHWTKQRDAFSERKSSPRWTYIVNILNAAACFIFTLCYLSFSAIPKYNTPVWETVTDFPQNIALPSLAYLTADGATGSGTESVQFVGSPSGNASTLGAAVVTFDYSTVLTTPGTYSTERIEDLGPIWPYGMTASIANISNEKLDISSPLQTSIVIETQLSYNSSTPAPGVGTTPPLIVFMAYDHRLSLREAMLCSVVQSYVVSAFASNTFTLSVSRISDRQQKMSPPEHLDSLCDHVYQDLLPTADPPMATFELALSSSVTSAPNFAEDCDIIANSSASCRNTVQLIYGTQFVNMQTSVPGKSKQDIWIDCGAIVGAVQFFAWFMYVFFQP